MVPVLVVCSLKYLIEIAACENPDVRENGHLSVKAINRAGTVTEKMQARTEVDTALLLRNIQVSQKAWQSPLLQVNYMYLLACLVL